MNDGGAPVYLYYYEEAVPVPDDPYNLDGKEFGLMNHLGGTSGRAFVAESKNGTNSLQLIDLVLSTTYYVSRDEDLVMWTFHNSEQDKYKLSAETENGTVYVKVENDGSISFVDDESAASELQVIPDSSGRIKLKDTATEYIIAYDADDLIFKAQASPSDTSQWFYFVDNSSIDEEETVTYTAEKISISDMVNARDGAHVIVYVRVWNEDEKKYNFYAVDCDGTLYPCFERGDKLMWIGGRANTLLWDLTVYMNEGVDYYTGLLEDENKYYELYNNASDKYIAPQITGNQSLSEEKIGINLHGRAIGEYYSTILAWDDNSYAFVGLKADIENNRVVPCTKAEAEADETGTFYFAEVDEYDDLLHTVDTIHNEDYGIKMWMIDYKSKSQGSGNNYQNDVFGGRNGNVKGLLQTHLEDDGYPLTANGTHSLGELYKNASSDIIGVRGGWKEVTGLFIQNIHDSTGYFEFDSCQNFATLIKDDGSVGNEFTVYKELGSTDGEKKTTLQHGQFLPYDVIEPGKYTTVNEQNLYSALANYRTGHEDQGLLEDSDPRKYERLYSVDITDYTGVEMPTGYTQPNNKPNYHNGMEMEASFLQTPDGKDAWGHDIIFEFTGDDDFWLYVDGELVIDLGGIHSAEQGTINFATGEVTMTNENGKLINQNGTVINRSMTLREIFQNNYKKRNSSATSAQVEEFLTGYFGESGSVFKNYTEHTMKMFYMERGGGASNLHMRFNLTYLRPGSVLLTKEVTGQDKSAVDISKVKYPYQIFYKTSADDPEMQLYPHDATDIYVHYVNSSEVVDYADTYSVPGSTDAPYEHVYFLSPGKSVQIDFPDQHIYSYQIKECGISSDVYDKVYINGDEVQGEAIGGTTNRQIYYNTTWSLVEDRQTVTFTNHLSPDGSKDLKITKELYDEFGRELTVDETKFKFRLSVYNETPKPLLDEANCQVYQDSAGKYYYIDEYGSIGIDDPDYSTISEYDRLARYGLRPVYVQGFEPASDYKYRVKNRAGEYCRWDSTELKFISTGKTKWESSDPDDPDVLTAEEKVHSTFETSLYGAIDKIPAWYTIEIPDVPVDTVFKIEERDTETPLGYKLAEYVCENDSYTCEQATQNIGTIKAGGDPHTLIRNHRGYGLKVNKVWSDNSVMKSHDPVYTAVYVSGVLLDGTVREITSENTSAEYFFEHLLDGKALSDYEIKEVKLTGAYTADDDGLVTGDYTVTPLAPGDSLEVAGTDKNIESVTNQYTVSYTAGIPNSIGNSRVDTVTNTRKGGVELTLYDMATNLPLANGEFKLYQGSGTGGTDLGTYVSDANGKITVLYCDKNTDYTIVESGAPKGYIGLPNSITFRLNDDNTITPAEQEESAGSNYYWEKGYKASDDGDILAKIDLYNKQFIFKVYKYNCAYPDMSKPIANAEFALYKNVTGIGGDTPNNKPMEGYEHLFSDPDGIVAGLNSKNLKNGIYYIQEIGREGYKPITEKIKFSIDDLGVVKLLSKPSDADGHQTSIVSSDENGKREYTINVPNVKDETVTTYAELYIRKTVAGSFGDKTKYFNFTFSVADPVEDGYEWSLAGVAQQEKIKSGESFKLKHGEWATIKLPSDSKVTVKENSAGYESSFVIVGEPAEQTDRKTFTVGEDDMTLNVVNTREGSVPTGIRLGLSLTILLFLATAAGVLYLLRRQGRYRMDDAE